MALDIRDINDVIPPIQSLTDPICPDTLPHTTPTLFNTKEKISGNPVRNGEYSNLPVTPNNIPFEP